MKIPFRKLIVHWQGHLINNSFKHLLGSCKCWGDKIKWRMGSSHSRVSWLLWKDGQRGPLHGFGSGECVPAKETASTKGGGTIRLWILRFWGSFSHLPAAGLGSLVLRWRGIHLQLWWSMFTRFSHILSPCANWSGAQWWCHWLPVSSRPLIVKYSVRIPSCSLSSRWLPHHYSWGAEGTSSHFYFWCKDKLRSLMKFRNRSQIFTEEEFPICFCGNRAYLT